VVWGALPRREDRSVIYSYVLLSTSGPSPAELMTTFYCPIWNSLNLEGQVHVFISPRNKVAQLYPRLLGYLLVKPKQVHVQFILRPTVSQPDRLGFGPPCRAHDQILIFFNNYFLSFSCRAPSPISTWTEWSRLDSKVKVTFLRSEFFNVSIVKTTWEACRATWNLSTNSAFALGPRKTTEKRDRVESRRNFRIQTDF
jgi:hypothetical protein